MLNGSNFKEWKENLLIVLGCLDLDYALREDKPSEIVAKSTQQHIQNVAQWNRSNRMVLMIIKKTIPEAFRGTISDSDPAKVYLEEIEKRFAKSEKS
ncbi:hypothetical protein LUZ61_017689 [Rhynchospora tenuis]|uniref:Retrotransposon Copia-like N-terminal domain-containing protein n=1 Tax=Rhynchospora tenuis TaxID=198213 RepID=A0AAD5Z7X1_9POAL|nr:hypothetical protein LUZ61_017689 [Rhynchospora tenuis]